MSRKKKSLRAFLHQHHNGDADSYIAGWDAQKGLAHARTINRYRKALEEILKSAEYPDSPMEHQIYEIAHRALDDE